MKMLIKILFLSLSSFLSLPSFASNVNPMNAKDPFESYNRVIYDFNVGFNDLIGEPVAKTYNNYVPDPAKTGIDNFFSNLKEPINMFNSFLQGKGQAGFTSLMRFSMNTVFGLGGLLDVATEARLTHKKEDLGQTLYQWGVWNEASFVMIPFLGPYTTRELIGSTIDNAYDPTYSYLIKTDSTGQTLLFVGGKFVDYAKVVSLAAEMKQQPDPYIFMRESYLQYRTNLIYDGKPPQPKLDDFNFE